MLTQRPIARLTCGLALAVAVALGSAACSSDDDGPTDAAPSRPAAQKAAGETASAVRNLAPAAFASAIQQQGTVILDVRTPEEFAEGHIDKAINIDFQGSDFAQQIGKLDKATSYALYCRSDRRSSLAAEQMHLTGFTTLVNLDGGVAAWTAAGQKLTTG